MNSFAIIFALLSLLIALAGLVIYFSKLKQNKTPKHPIGLAATLPTSILLGAYAFSLSSSTVETIVTAVPLVLNSSISAILLFFLVQKNTPIGNIRLKVGDNMLPFISETFEGETFSTSSLMGKRTLLKFYRGSWCPYCNAELVMFRDMQPELSAYGVSILALSGDTPQQEQAHIERDKLNFTLLSDPTLTIVKQYGVEHHKAVGWESNNIKTIFGLSMSFSMLQYRSMPIPTSILIDEKGIVKWIDQSDDYRLRASQEKMLAAIKNSFKA